MSWLVSFFRRALLSLVRVSYFAFRDSRAKAAFKDTRMATKKEPKSHRPEMN